jgi:hypothetical protein
MRHLFGDRVPESKPSQKIQNLTDHMVRETRWRLASSRLAEAQWPFFRGAIKGFSFSDHPGPNRPQLTRLWLADPGETPLSGCWPIWLLAIFPSHANKAAADDFASPP